MEERDYTHVQVLLPEIKAMLAEGIRYNNGPVDKVHPKTPTLWYN